MILNQVIGIWDHMLGLALTYIFKYAQFKDSFCLVLWLFFYFSEPKRIDIFFSVKEIRDLQLDTFYMNLLPMHVYSSKISDN